MSKRAVVEKVSPPEESSESPIMTPKKVDLEFLDDGQSVLE